MKGVIYCYHCIPTGKKYIGKTKNENKRKQRHRYNAKKGIKNNFYNAVRKYGWDNFVYGIINEFDISILNEKELYYINFYDTYKNGYNLTIGGEGGTTWVMPEDIKKQYRERMLGHKLSDEVKKKISQSNRGRKWSKEAKENLSKKLKGRKGHTISNKAKEKMSKMRKGVPRPKKVIDKIVETKKQNYNPKNHSTSKTFIFISPNGKEYSVTGGFKAFCEEQNLSHWGMRNIIKTGKIVPGCKKWSVRKGD